MTGFDSSSGAVVTARVRSSYQRLAVEAESSSGRITAVHQAETWTAGSKSPTDLLSDRID
jgi:hypothetical protein